MNNKYQELIHPHLHEVAALLDSGKTTATIAEWLGISVTTLRRYRKQFPELDRLFRCRQELCDDMVEAALLRRATGYEDNSGKEIAPDVRAAVFWLQNRRPKEWCATAKKRKAGRKQKLEIRISETEAAL